MSLLCLFKAGHKVLWRMQPLGDTTTNAKQVWQGPGFAAWDVGIKSTVNYGTPACEIVRL